MSPEQPPDHSQVLTLPLTAAIPGDWFLDFAEFYLFIIIVIIFNAPLWEIFQGWFYYYCYYQPVVLFFFFLITNIFFSVSFSPSSISAAGCPAAQRGGWVPAPRGCPALSPGEDGDAKRPWAVRGRSRAQLGSLVLGGSAGSFVEGCRARCALSPTLSSPFHFLSLWSRFSNSECSCKCLALFSGF